MLELISRIWRKASKTQEQPLRHLFAIEVLSNGRPYRDFKYRYYCIRCHWLFMVDRRGGVVALDDRARPLAIGEGALRVRTFARGPCEGTANPVSIRDVEPRPRVARIRRRRRLKARSLSALP
jgi:nucleoside-diphosphate-sugar epimerase